MIDINLMGLMYSTHAAVPHLVRAAAEQPRQVAGIVNIGSLAGRRAFAMSAVYCATKFGVGAFSGALARSWHASTSASPSSNRASSTPTGRPHPGRRPAARPPWATSSGCRARTLPTPSATSSPAPGTWPSPS
ncbi:SDR family NAD(P)-dependent oxidoreductase [Streptomyces sp. NPDC001233]